MSLCSRLREGGDRGRECEPLLALARGRGQGEGVRALARARISGNTSSSSHPRQIITSNVSIPQERRFPSIAPPPRGYAGSYSEGRLMISPFARVIWFGIKQLSTWILDTDEERLAKALNALHG